MQIWSNPGSAAGSLHLKGVIKEKKKKNLRSCWQEEGSLRDEQKQQRLDGEQREDSCERWRGGRGRRRRRKTNSPSSLRISHQWNMQPAAGESGRELTRTNQSPEPTLHLFERRWNWITHRLLSLPPPWIFFSPVNSAGIVSVSTLRLMRQTLPVSWISIPLSLPAVNLRRWTFSFLRLFVRSFFLFFSFIVCSNLTCVSCDTHSGLRFSSCLSSFFFSQPPFSFCTATRVISLWHFKLKKWIICFPITMTELFKGLCDDQSVCNELFYSHVSNVSGNLPYIK